MQNTTSFFSERDCCISTGYITSNFFCPVLRLVADKLPINDVLSLKTSSKQISTILDSKYLEQKVVKDIANGAVEGLKNLTFQENFPAAIAVVDSLVKFDIPAALKFSERLNNNGPKGPVRESLAKIRIACQCKSKERAKQIYTGVISKLQNYIPNAKSPHEKEFSKVAFLLACSILTKAGFKLSDDILEQSEKYLEILSNILQVNSYNYISLMTQKSLDRLCTHLFENFQIHHWNSAFLKTGKFTGEEENLGYASDWRGRVYKNARYILGNLNERLKSIHTLFVDLENPSLLRIKCLMKIHKELQGKQDFKNAKNVLKIAKEIAMKSNHVLTIAELGKEYSPYSKTEATALFERALNLFNQMEDSWVNEFDHTISKYTSLTHIARKMRKHAPEQAYKYFSQIILNHYKHSQITFDQSWKEEFTKIVKDAPASFWTPKLKQLFPNLNPEFKLLFQLKILENCKNPAIKELFKDKLEKL